MKNYVYRTEKSYLYWIKQYILFHNKRRPNEMGDSEIEQFLTHLATKKKVAEICIFLAEGLVTANEEFSPETRLISRMIKMMASLSELDQMIRDGQGKSHRFAEILVSQYYDYIHRLAASILGDPADADDICQETFIDALLYIDRYSPGTNLKAWLSKIAVHKCRQVQRKRKIRDSFLAVIRTRQSILSKSHTPFEVILEKEGSEQVWAAINALKEKHRIPVILYYVYELKVREIAGILEIPEGTVSSRLHYAIQKLENRLKRPVE